MKPKLAASVATITLVAALPATADDHGAAYWTQMEQFEAQHPPAPARGSWSVNRPSQTNTQGCSPNQVDVRECKIKQKMAKDTSFPFYPDPTPTCRQIASYNDMIFNTCVKKAQSYYNTAKSLWPNMSAYTRAWCLLNEGEGQVRDDLKYVMLGECALKMYYGYDIPREAPEAFTR